MLADDRENAAEKTRIYFPVLDTPESVAESVFTQP
jgi:hypothetical protein